MLKNISILVMFIILIVASHYYGVQRGAKATSDIVLLQLGMQSVDNMVLNSAMLLSLKNGDSKTALNFAKQLVEQDVKHLAKIEEMLESLDLEEFEKNVFRYSILEAKENHKLVNDL